MNRHRKIFAIALVLLSGCSGTPYPIPVGANTPYYGNLRSGEKFGVAIGEDSLSARSALERQNFRYDQVFACDVPIRELLDCERSETFALYRLDQFGRQGTLYLKIDHKRIAAIAWSFQLIRLDT